MIGICIQYYVDNYRLSHIERSMLEIILRYTFGFKKRNAYVSQKIFELNSKTLKKYRDMLSEKGILKWKKTRKYTIYEIIEPKKEIEKFVLRDGVNVVHNKKKEQKLNLDAW